MSELCEHETFRSICGICHQDNIITRLRAEVEKLKADIAYADKHAAKVESLLWGTSKENAKLAEAIKVAIRQHEEGNKGLAHRTLCEAVYGEQK